MRWPTVFQGAPSKAARGRKRRLRRGGGLASLSLSVITILSALLVLGWTWSQPLPEGAYDLSKTAEVPAERELLLLDAYGVPFARRGGCLDAPVKFAALPPHLINALLTMEDRRFFAHAGLDPVGVLRAAAVNLRAGRVVQGGSTITQQLAKLTYLTSTKTFARKFKEAVIGLWLELNLTKEQILERYLSRAYFGEGCTGLRAAARRFFGRKIADLTLAQSAYLVALLKSPARYAANRQELRRRERLVLETMARNGHLSRLRLRRTVPAETLNEEPPVLGAYYADWIEEIVELPNDGKKSVLPVQTHYDPLLQQLADKTIRHVLRRYGASRWVRQAALVAMRPDGRVVAISGGKNYASSQFNRATQALRQPGSSFKPFVYLAALRAGVTPDMVVSDTPLRIGGWSPENYDGRYRGPVPLLRAFSSSLNTVAVRLSEWAGRAQVLDAARDLGIGTQLKPVPSVALGTSEVTLLELTGAYAAFAAGAYPVKPWGVISTGARSPAPARPPKGAGRWNLPEADVMREFLSHTVRYGTGRGARLAIPAYGKTGTSQSYRDAWFIGFAGNLVVGVWVGNDDNSPTNGVTGGSLPAMIWRSFVNVAQRKDGHFTPNLPMKIAGFRAETAPDDLNANPAEPLPLVEVQSMAEPAAAPQRAQPRSHGKAMMLAPPQAPKHETSRGKPAAKPPSAKPPRGERWAPWERMDGPG